jgi:hypothetical protein
MDAKLLTESGWKAVVSKFKIHDNGLQRALASLEKLDEKDFDAQLKALDSVDSLATSLKKSKDIAANAQVVKYLENVIDAADASSKEAKAAAAAAEKQAAQAKKAEEQKAKEDKAKGDKDDKDDDEDEEEEGDYAGRLLKSLMKVRSGNKALDFIVCDARPAPAIMVAKRITPKHKQELTEITGGSKRFLPIGSCHFEGGGYVFSTPNAVPGMARKIQLAIKDHTGKKFKVVYGGESADEDDGGKPAAGGEQQEEGQAPSAPAGAGAAAPAAAETPAQGGAAAPPPPQSGAPAPPKPELVKAPSLWHSTRDTIDKTIDALKKAVKAHYATSHPDLIKEIDQGLDKLDVILDKLDSKLEDSLKKAATDKAELKNSKAILVQYITYVKSEPLIAHIDSNPFGVQTNLKQTLTDSLTHMAQAIS